MVLSNGAQGHHPDGTNMVDTPVVLVIKSSDLFLSLESTQVSSPSPHLM